MPPTKKGARKVSMNEAIPGFPLMICDTPTSDPKVKESCSENRQKSSWDLAPVKQKHLWERKDYAVLQSYQVIQSGLILGNKFVIEDTRQTPFELFQAICGSIMPGNVLKGLIVSIWARRLLIAGLLPSPSCKPSTIFVFQLSVFVRRL